MSLKVTTTISRISKAKKMPWSQASYLGLSFLPDRRNQSYPTSSRKIRPPSRAGMGSRFIMARFTAIKAMM